MVGLASVQRLRDVLGVDAPVVQSGMGTVAGAELAAAVSNAGGLGVLAALFVPPAELRTQIRRMRELTDRPFGVNIWLHREVRRPVDASTIDEGTAAPVHGFFNGLRPRFGLEDRGGGAPQLPDQVDAALEVMLEEAIPVFSAGLGVPEAALCDRFHAAGTKVMSMVTNADDALAAVDAGADVVVAQGAEAGGHRSTGSKLPLPQALGVGMFSLVPEVVDRVGGRVPVVAAGGVVDGRGLAAALVLGASGVLMGTRFVATAESMASAAWKAALVGGRGETVLTDGFTGQWARTIRSEFTDRWSASGVTPLPGLTQVAMGGDLFAAAVAQGDDQMQGLHAGASFSRITDLPTAGEIVRRIVAEAEDLVGLLAPPTM